jgi:hypothetical protein
LEQILSSEEEQKWVEKMQGFYFQITYKKGKYNVVADALPKIEEALSLYSIPMWLDKVGHEWNNENTTRYKIQCIKEGMSSMEHWEWNRDILWYLGRIFVCPKLKLKKQIFMESHDSPVAGHSGFLNTYQRIKKDILGEGMKKDIQKFVRKCHVCQKNKGETVKYPGLLQSLHIPNQRWEEISMGFIKNLPKSKGKDANFVVVDRLKKYAHLCGIRSKYIAIQVAEVPMKEILRLHGFPKVIVSDRDPKFMRNFWKELWNVSGTTLATIHKYMVK